MARMKRPTALALALLVLTASFAACAEASGEVRGGGNELNTQPATYIGCDVTETIDAGTGTTWNEIHRDLFSANSPGGCASAACHGSDEGSGFKASGFKCTDAAGCRQGILEYGLVTLPADQQDPARSALIGILRRCTDERATVGIMPKQPRSYYFSKASIARIRAWVAAGAPE